MGGTKAKLSVTILAGNPETNRELNSYFREAGIASQATGAIWCDARMVAKSSNAVVIFPDEFGVDDVVTSVMSLRHSRPKLLVLLITATPQRFREALAPDGRSLPPIVLSKPAFGWTILDVIRAHTDTV
ncbi:MAG: hypothetical protein KBF88_02635 [Polyangiaceae bacterium]|nr:hypothetical protein [Polyangiaceae bacterium]